MPYEIVTYQEHGLRLETRFEDGQAWATIAQLAELFGIDRRTIERHIENILAEKELPRSTSTEFVEVRTEGNRSVNRSIQHVNQEMALHVGYRVRSERGSEFRRWATAIIKGEAPSLQERNFVQQIQDVVAPMLEAFTESINILLDTRLAPPPTLVPSSEEVDELHERARLLAPSLGMTPRALTIQVKKQFKLYSWRSISTREKYNAVVRFLDQKEAGTQIPAEPVAKEYSLAALRDMHEPLEITSENARLILLEIGAVSERRGFYWLTDSQMREWRDCNPT